MLASAWPTSYALLFFRDVRGDSFVLKTQRDAAMQKDTIFTTSLDQTIFAIHRGLDCLNRVGPHLNDQQWWNGPLEYAEEQLQKAQAYFAQAAEHISKRRALMLEDSSLPVR